MPKAQAYNVTMYVMAGLLVIGFIANALVKAVDARYHMKPGPTRRRRPCAPASPVNRLALEGGSSWRI